MREADDLDEELWQELLLTSPRKQQTPDIRRSFWEMEPTVEESLALALRPTGNETGEEDAVQNERLGFQVECFKLQEENQICQVLKRRRGRRRCKRRSCDEKMKFGEKMIHSVADMTISRSCRYRLSVPVMFWTTVFLVLLARGVSSSRDEQTRFSRSPKYEQDGDVQGGLITPNAQETYNVMQFLRELLQRQQQRTNQQQLQVYNNGEDLSDNQIDWRKVPLPLLYQIRSLISDGSKEEDKRGSYMSLCHFKICNLG